MDFEEIKEPRDLDSKMIKEVVFALIQEVKQLKDKTKGAESINDESWIMASDDLPDKRYVEAITDKGNFYRTRLVELSQGKIEWAFIKNEVVVKWRYI